MWCTHYIPVHCVCYTNASPNLFLYTAPICAPLQLNYTTNSSSSVTTTINFTWVSNNDASCGDSDILGQVIYCSSNQTRNSLSYIVLPSSSKYSLTVTQQDAQHFVNLSCYATHFNGAGEGPKSKSVTLHPQVIPSGMLYGRMKPEQVNGSALHNYRHIVCQSYQRLCLDLLLAIANLVLVLCCVTAVQTKQETPCRTLF